MTLIGLVFGCTFLVFIGNAHSQGIVFPPEQEVRTCSSGSQCVVVKRCPAATSSGNGRSPDRAICGYTRGPRRRPMICCPRTGNINDPPVQPVRQPNAPAVPTPAINSADCGLPRDAAQTGFVMGGKRARPGAWPWMVAIQMANDQGRQAPWCTGFLITRRHVLTAAHCFERPQASLYELRIAHTDLREGRTYSIQTIKVHEGYRPGTYYDDIALLTLTRDANEPDVNVVCLPVGRLTRRDFTGEGTTVAGWGAERSGGAMSNYLLFLDGMPVVSNTQCNTIFNERLRSFSRQFPKGITPGFMCAGYMEGGKDSCGRSGDIWLTVIMKTAMFAKIQSMKNKNVKGDSGGPLMFLSKGKWYAIGIVSFGYDCGKVGFPGGYTRVSAYMDWIQRNL